MEKRIRLLEKKLRDEYEVKTLEKVEQILKEVTDPRDKPKFLPKKN